MSYDATRDSEQLRMLEPSIEAFIDRYNLNTAWAANGQRQTVFVFPGGMASRLRRATTSYQGSAGTSQLFNYDTLWVDGFGTLLGGTAAELKLTKTSKAEYRDKDDRIIVADGCIGFLGCTPYSGLADWCQASGLDYFIFGWDWRRKIQHAGRFFIEKFLPRFQAMVQAGCNGADPLERFSLVGHSAGGMVVNWIYRKNPPALAKLHRAVTVATPFYGYASQLHRWFEGEPYCNGPLNIFRAKIIRAICSMPACYTWLYVDAQTYADNSAALAADPQYPLAKYPCTDFATGQLADPYAPQTQGSKVRYPSAGATGFDLGELKRAGRLVRRLAADFDPALDLGKFYNVRCDTGKADTHGSSTWKWLPPSSPSPIDDPTLVAGDGTQPGWSARHVGLQALRPNQVRSVVAGDVEHMFSMNSSHVQLELGAILGVQVPVKIVELDLDIASSQEALAFVRQLQDQFKTKVRSTKDRQRLREILARYDNDELRAIARRVMIDLVAPPIREQAARGRGAARKRTAKRAPKRSAKRSSRR